MRAVDPVTQVTRIDDEIFDDIKRLGLGLIEQDVRKFISNMHLLKDKPPTWGYRKENLEYLANLGERIEALKTTLEAMPNDELLLALFTPELKVSPPDNRVSSFVREIDSMQDAAEMRHEELILMLTGLRAQSDQLADAKPGKHKLAGYQQFRAALAARLLMLRAGKRPAR
jgi:hypothetical protein